MKKQIHLNESELHRLVKESVRRVLRESMNEIGDTPQGQSALGYLYGRRGNQDVCDYAMSKHNIKGKNGNKDWHPSFYKSWVKGEDERTKEIINRLASDNYFWNVDFDPDGYDLPENWDDMTDIEKAEFVYYHSSYDNDEWDNYLA